MGISDVAFAKRCKKLNIPRPPRGYWAKIAVGRKPAKKPLPAGDEEKLLGKDPVSSRVAILENKRQLHAAAQDLLAALRAATPDTEGLVKVQGRTFPCAEVSVALIDRTVRCLSSILTMAENRGVPFKKARSSYDTAYFERKNSRLSIEIHEPVVTVKVDPATQDKRRSPWEWKTSYREPSQKLTFTIGSDLRTRGKGKNWSESESQTLEETLREVVDGICEHYAELDRERVREEGRRRQHAEEYKLKQEEERKMKHTASIEAAARQRTEDLLIAAEWWRLYRTARDFIDSCEKNWRSSQPDELTEEQESWLRWAHEQSEALSPFQMAYPDPAKDGEFDPANVPPDGPYPATRNFPRPPTMPKIPPPVEQHTGWSASPPAPQPYPFWLRYPRR